MPLEHRSCRITRISPIAVSISKSVRFSVRGFNLVMPKSKYEITHFLCFPYFGEIIELIRLHFCRLFCALEGKYLAEEDVSDLVKEVETAGEHDVLQSLNVQCSIPETCGRGFIEVLPELVPYLMPR